jgi:4-amino-4-deoxy-L-arabinose transferase-like glycosyltransferase
MASGRGRAVEPADAMNARSARRSEWVVLLVAALVWLPGLGVRDLWSPDEPRIAQVADELRARRAGPAGVVLLHLDGRPYTQKPPLYYWLVAGLGAPFGQVDAWAARAPSAVGALASLALTMALARRWFGPQVAPWAGALLLVSVRFSELGQRAQLDALLTACELAAWLAWVRGERGELDRVRARTWLHAALGAGMLVKGPVALLPLAAIAIQLGLEQRTRELRTLFALRGWTLSLGPFLLWGGAALMLAPAGFFQQAVVENLCARFLTGSSHVRPFYYYAYQLPLDFLPSTLLLPAAVVGAWRARRGTSEADRSWRLLSVWVLVFLAFFSLSAGKRGLYLVPMFPALAIGCAAALVAALAQRRSLPWGLGWVLGALAGALALAAAAFWTGTSLSLELPQTVRVPAAFPAAVVTLCIAALAAGVFSAARGYGALVRAGLALLAIALLQASTYRLLYPALDPERSLRPIAQAALALARPGETIGVVDHATLIPGLTYYACGEPGRFEHLADRAAIEEFLTSGRGQVVVSELRRGWALESIPHPRRAEFRSGRRLAWVHAPATRQQVAAGATCR